MVRRRSAAGRARGPSQRQLRAGELVRHALAEVLMREELHDPVLDGVPITVSEVRMSADLRQATCFILPLGGERGDDVLQALQRRQGWLGGQVARRVELKFAPRLSFELDRSFAEAGKIDRLLRGLRSPAPGGRGPGAAGGEEGSGDGA